MLANEVQHLLTDREVATRLAVSISAVRKWRFEGRGPTFVRIGRAVRYRLADVEAYVDRQLVQTSDGGCSPKAVEIARREQS